MRKPNWLKPGVKVKVSNYPVYDETTERDEHEWVGTVGTTAVSERYTDPTDGGSYDAYLKHTDGEGHWVQWEDLSLAPNITILPEISLNKTERKKVAKELKKSFDELVKNIDYAESKGLEIDLYIDQEFWNEKHIKVSYQPSTPPKEEYVK